MSVLDVRNEEDATSTALDIDGQAEVDALALDQMRLPIDLRIRGFHAGPRLEGLQDGPPDQVGERNLSAAPAGEIAVDDPAVLLEVLRGDAAPRCRWGNRQRRVHVLGDACRDAAKGHRPLDGDRLGSHRAGPLLADWLRARALLFGGRRLLLCLRNGAVAGLVSFGDLHAGGPVVLEEVSPRLGNRLRILLVPPVHLVHEPDIRPEGLLLDFLLVQGCSPSPRGELIRISALSTRVTNLPRRPGQESSWLVIPWDHALRHGTVTARGPEIGGRGSRA